MKQFMCFVALVLGLSAVHAHAVASTPSNSGMPSDWKRQMAEAEYFHEANAPDKPSRQVLAHEILYLDQRPGLPAVANNRLDPQAIHDNYTQLIEQNFARRTAWSARRLIDSLSDHELHSILYYYHLHTGAVPGRTLLMQVMDHRLDALRLARVQTMEAQVAQEPPPAGPNWEDMTLEEIWSTIRTARLGGMSLPTCALQFANVAGRLATAYQIGYSIGTKVSQLIDEYDPALNDAIGEYIAYGVDQLYDAGYDWKAMGVAEQYLGEVFHWPPPSINVPIGYEDTEQTGGGDYGASGQWNEGYDTNWGGLGGSCWPFECSMR